MQIKDRAKSIKFASVCDNSAKARGKLLLYFRSKKSEKGGLKIANQNFIIDAEIYQVWLRQRIRQFVEAAAIGRVWDV